MGESQTLSIQKEKRLISKRWTEPMHHILKNSKNGGKILEKKT